MWALGTLRELRVGDSTRSAGGGNLHSAVNNKNLNTGWGRVIKKTPHILVSTIKQWTSDACVDRG